MSQSNEREQTRLLGALGLCARARALIFGTPMVCEALRNGQRPRLVLEAADTSDGTHKRLTDKCSFYGVRHVRLPVTGLTLAAALGKRSSLAAVALTDEQLCRLVEKHLPDHTQANDQNDLA